VGRLVRRAGGPPRQMLKVKRGKDRDGGERRERGTTSQRGGEGRREWNVGRGPGALSFLDIFVHGPSRVQLHHCWWFTVASAAAITWAVSQKITNCFETGSWNIAEKMHEISKHFKAKHLIAHLYTWHARFGAFKNRQFSGSLNEQRTFQIQCIILSPGSYFKDA